MDFQDAFLTLYWHAWAMMLGLYVAATVFLCIYDLLTRSSHNWRFWRWHDEDSDRF